jgi:hypothetical protein
MRLTFAANEKRLTELIRTKPELVLPLREFRAINALRSPQNSEVGSWTSESARLRSDI